MILKCLLTITIEYIRILSTIEISKDMKSKFIAEIQEEES